MYVAIVLIQVLFKKAAAAGDILLHFDNQTFMAIHASTMVLSGADSFSRGK